MVSWMDQPKNVEPRVKEVYSQQALDLHNSSLVVDTHADSISRYVDDGEDLATETGRGHLDLPRIREGNLGVQWWSCYVAASKIPTKDTVERCLELLDGLKRLCAANPDDFEIALTAADCRRIVAAGKHAAVPCIEGGHAINQNLGLLRQYWDLGMRYITLTHFNSNTWADASTDASRNNGLSEFGQDVVREMNRLGMVVDISHVSDKTFWDVVEVATQPVMASHSSAWALCEHPRNMKDDMLRAVASNGGVVNVNFCPIFVTEAYRLGSERLLTRRSKDPKGRRRDATVLSQIIRETVSNRSHLERHNYAKFRCWKQGRRASQIGRF